MDFYAGALFLVSYAFSVFISHHREFTITLVIAIVLAGGCWGAASYYSHLWNHTFRITILHHMLCLSAAVCTLTVTLAFISLKYTKQAADLTIDIWKAQLVTDTGWGSSTYRMAYEQVKALGLEDFSTALPPEQGGHIPVNQAQSKKRAAEVYANAAVRNFQVIHPFLSTILKVRSDIPAGLIDQKMTEFFQHKPGTVYPAEEAINIAAGEIKSGLQTQTEWIVPLTRALLVALFVMVQLLPFGIIGYAAYRDIKVIT